MAETADLVPLSNLLLALIIVSLAIGVCAGLAYLFKSKFKLPSIRQSMYPPSRLSVLETIPVDQKRKLVLISKDGQEHLIMTGGPSDLIIETAQIQQTHQQNFEPRTHEIPGDKTLVASNDEFNERELQNQTYGVTQQAAEEVPNENDAEAAQKALAMLLSEDADLSENTVAAAVGMLTSEEEVGDFFDQARNRVFANETAQTETAKDDTDDFNAVLRAQQNSRAKISNELTEEQQRYLQQKNQIAERSNAQAQQPLTRNIKPIPESAEERLRNIRSLLGQNKSK